MPEDIKFTDYEYHNLPEGYDRSKLKPQNYWDGPWIEKIDELGMSYMAPAIDFKEKEYMELWRMDPNDNNHFIRI